MILIIKRYLTRMKSKASAVLLDNDVIINNVYDFDPAQTFDCGQAFRWNQNQNGNWVGIVKDKMIELCYSDNTITLYNTNLQEYQSFWKEYLDLEFDYSSVIEKFKEDPVLYKAAIENRGIRILKQDSWEALCSFIISQNNNIPRIKGIIERLCINFGERIKGGYSFPTADTLAKLTPDDLLPIRAGFRARYIIDAAQKFSTNMIDTHLIKTADIDTARAELMKIIGVGEKVADCTLLFGFHRIDALPKDVWIKRVIKDIFNGTFPECAKGYEGIAQQYLFNYIRNL